MEELVDEFDRHSVKDIIGLWQVVQAAKAQAKGETQGDVQRVTLDLLRRMLNRGFQAGYLSESGRTLEPWPNQNPEAFIHRIETEWKALWTRANHCRHRLV